MSVWVLTYGDYEDRSIIGVFSTEDAAILDALEYADSEPAHKERVSFDLTEWPVDSPGRVWPMSVEICIDRSP